MLYSHMPKYLPAASLIPILLAAHAANAAPSPENMAEPIIIPGATPLTPAELGAIRGGFDLGPKLSIDFAFRQIDTVGGKVIQSIVVPTVTVTQTSPTSVPITVTNADGNTQTITPSPGSNVTLTGTANSGLTTIISSLGASGVSNVVSNQANNAVASVATTMDIGITGLSPWLTQQQITTNVQNGLYYNNGGFK